MTDDDIGLIQQLVRDRELGAEFTLRELFGERWAQVPHPQVFGDEFGDLLDEGRFPEVERLMPPGRGKVVKRYRRIR